MAPAILRRPGGDRFEVHRAVLEQESISPFTLQGMIEKGYDLRAQYSKAVGEYPGRLSIQTPITL